MGRLRMFRRQGKGAAAAFERLVKAAIVEQRLGRAAVQHSQSRAAAVAASQQLQAGSKLPGAERRRECVGVDQEWGSFSTEIQFQGVSLYVSLNQRVKIARVPRSPQL